MNSRLWKTKPTPEKRQIPQRNFSTDVPPVRHDAKVNDRLCFVRKTDKEEAIVSCSPKLVEFKRKPKEKSKTQEENHTQWLFQPKRAIALTETKPVSLSNKLKDYERDGARPKILPEKDKTSQKLTSRVKRVYNPAPQAPRRKSSAIKMNDERKQSEQAGRRAAPQCLSINIEKLGAVPSTPFLDLFKRKVKLTRSDIKRHSQMVNDVISNLLEEVKSLDSLFCLDILHTGSYYEFLKVCRAYEFDIMVYFKENQVARYFKVECPTRECVGFAHLKYQDWIKQCINWRNYLTSDEKYLSPVKIRERFLDLLRKSIKNQEQQLKRRNEGVNHLSVEANGPAAKVTINRKIDVDVVISLEVTGWPACANGWGDFASTKTWPTQGTVEKIKNEKKFYLVAKDPNLPGELEIPESRRCKWRISFSKAEKSLLRPASDSQQKKCYRIIKYIFEAHREKLRPLCSYHLKTLFLHKRKSNAGQEACSDSKVGQYVVRFLHDLKDHIKEGELKHFFVARINLLSAMEKEDRDKIAQALERILWELVNNPFDILPDLQVQ